MSKRKQEEYHQPIFQEFFLLKVGENGYVCSFNSLLGFANEDQAKIAALSPEVQEEVTKFNASGYVEMVLVTRLGAIQIATEKDCPLCQEILVLNHGDFVGRGDLENCLEKIPLF